MPEPVHVPVSAVSLRPTAVVPATLGFAVAIGPPRTVAAGRRGSGEGGDRRQDEREHLGSTAFPTSSTCVVCFFPFYAAARSPHVDQVDRQRDPEEEEDADAPGGRVLAAVAVGVQEDRDAGRRSRS